MAATYYWYNSFSEYSSDGTIDLDTDTFKVTLHNSSFTFAATNTVYADLANELSTANGYTNGGQELTSVTWTRSGSTSTFDFANPKWTASGGAITARYAVIRKSGTANSITDPLVCAILMDNTPADVSAANGETFNLIIDDLGLFTKTMTTA